MTKLYELRTEDMLHERFEAADEHEARREALSWMSDAEFDLSSGPVHYRGYLFEILTDKDGNETEEFVENVTCTFEPIEPGCVGHKEHDWRAPHSIVGGVKENPGVYGHGGGVTITEVCAHCGAYREIDTWAQDPQTGEQGLHTTTYRPADEESLDWVNSRRDEAR